MKDYAGIARATASSDLSDDTEGELVEEGAKPNPFITPPARLVVLDLGDILRRLK